MYLHREDLGLKVLSIQEGIWGPSIFMRYMDNYSNRSAAIDPSQA